MCHSTMTLLTLKKKQNITKQKYLKHLSVTNYQRDIVLQQLMTKAFDFIKTRW